MFKNNFSIDSKTFYKNLKKTKKIFKSIKSDIKNSKLQMLDSCKKNYKLDFSLKTVKKFSKYKSN